MKVMIFVFLFFVSCMGLNIQMDKQEKCDLSVNKADMPIDTPLSFSKFNHGSSYQGLFVNEKAKFAFCTIEKNACSKWTAILAKIHFGNVNLNGPVYGISHKAWNEKSVEAVFKDPKATRAVFVRDPLERFLSAYLSKCMDKTCSNPFCFMRPKALRGHPIPFSSAVEWINAVNVSNLDGHFKLQSAHCELDQRIHEYNVIGLFTHNTLAADATCLMEKAGLSKFNTIGQGAVNAPFWHLPNQDSNSNQEHIELLKSFYTRESAELLYQKFAKDYALFGLPRPAWIDEAHGKLFHDTAGTSKCAEKSLIKEYQDANYDDDEDDIVILANRAGFSF